MAIAHWNGVPIPGIRDIEENDLLQADEQATAGGMLRRDVVVHRRRWTLRTAPIPVAQAEQLRAALRAMCYGPGQFAIAGQPAVAAYADPPTVRWVLGTDRRVVELTITEQFGRAE